LLINFGIFQGFLGLKVWVKGLDLKIVESKGLGLNLNQPRTKKIFKALTWKILKFKAIKQGT